MQELSVGRPVEMDLVPSQDQLEQLSVRPDELIAQKDIGQSRILASMRAAERLAGTSGAPHGMAVLDLTFHPSPGNRFKSAQIRMTLDTPESVRFIEVAPTQTLSEGVEVTIDDSGGISLGVPKLVGAEGKTGRKVVFKKHDYTVRGSGRAVRSAYWTLTEPSYSEEGIGQTFELTVTLPAEWDVLGRLAVTAVLARPGIAGSLEAVRELVLPKRYPFRIEFSEPNGQDESIDD